MRGLVFGLCLSLLSNYSTANPENVLSTLDALRKTATQLALPKVEQILGTKFHSLERSSKEPPRYYAASGAPGGRIRKVYYYGTDKHWDGRIRIELADTAGVTIATVRRHYGAPTDNTKTQTFDPPTTGCIYIYKQPWGHMQFFAPFSTDVNSIEFETNTAEKVRRAEDEAREKMEQQKADARAKRPLPRNMSAAHVWAVIAQLEAAGRSITLPQFEAIVRRKLQPEPGVVLIGAPSMVNDLDAPYVDEFSRTEWRADTGQRPTLFLTLLDTMTISAQEVQQRFGKPARIDQYHVGTGGTKYEYDRPWGTLELHFTNDEKKLKQINLDFTMSRKIGAR
jgi:hypothetical protein